jgi:hypothetical protein
VAANNNKNFTNTEFLKDDVQGYLTLSKVVTYHYFEHRYLVRIEDKAGVEICHRSVDEDKMCRGAVHRTPQRYEQRYDRKQ